MHKSSKWLIGEIIVVISAVTLLGFLRHPFLFSYQWHKLLHIFGAVLLLGNIIITGVWILMAERINNSDVMRFAAKTVNWADVYFTVPGIFLLITNGDILSEQWGGVFQTSWITASLALFALSGMLWIGFLLRYQHSLIKLSQPMNGEKSSPEFFTVLHCCPVKIEPLV